MQSENITLIETYSSVRKEDVLYMLSP